MPRQARLDTPGLLQHVIVRGVNRADIFWDDEDRHQFVSRLSRLLVETETECFAWALLPNHAHLLLRCKGIELARFMRRLLTGYAVTFNRRHERVGHLFQNRYKSIACEENPYFLELIRYIHLNPLRAGLVKDLGELDSYPWCGHAVVLGQRALSGQSLDVLLMNFATTLKMARRSYRQFMADGAGMGERPEFVGGRTKNMDSVVNGYFGPAVFDDRILGGDSFVKAHAGQALAGQRSRIMTLDELLMEVAVYFNCSAAELRRRGRRNAQAEARELFCYLAARQLRCSGARIGAVLDMGVPSVSRAARRGESLISSRPEFGLWWEALLKQ